MIFSLRRFRGNNRIELCLVVFRRQLEDHAARPIELQLEEQISALSAELNQEQTEETVAPRPKKLKGRLGAMASGMAFDVSTASAHSKPRTRFETMAKLERSKEQLQLLRKEIKSEILTSASVVVATCIASGELTDQYKVVLIDEASQATEPTCLVPISKGCRQLILVGDANQLPPTVKTSVAMDGGLGYSMFERLQDAGVSAIMLDTQYRMHEWISKFPAAQFYGGMLRDSSSVASLVPPVGYDWPLAADGAQLPVEFVPVTGKEQDSMDGTSKTNRQEADAIMECLDGLLQAGEIGANDVGVVTPYKGQVELLRKRVELDERFTGVEINSVDGFQGREKEVILFSAVRANDRRAVGFLADWRRLNVAMTRARRGLVVFGDPNTLSNDTTWNAWLEWARSNGAFLAASVTAPSQEEMAPAEEAAPAVAFSSDVAFSEEPKQVQTASA